jgi:hypothetical protein
MDHPYENAGQRREALIRERGELQQTDTWCSNCLKQAQETVTRLETLGTVTLEALDAKEREIVSAFGPAALKWPTDETVGQPAPPDRKS